MDLYSASSLKQQSVGRHVAPFGHVIVTQTLSVFVLITQCYVPRGEAANTWSILKSLVRPDQGWIPRSTALEASTHVVHWRRTSFATRIASLTILQFPLLFGNVAFA